MITFSRAYQPTVSYQHDAALTAFLVEKVQLQVGAKLCCLFGSDFSSALLSKGRHAFGPRFFFFFLILTSFLEAHVMLSRNRS